MRKPKLFIALLRVAVGWLFFYQGVIAIKDSSWSILPFIKDAQTFPAFYALASAQPLLLYGTYAAKGIFVIAGVLLILGVGMRIASFLGIVLMAFFYFPSLHFPYVTHDGTVFYVVDYRMIYIMILLYLFAFNHKESVGLGSLFRSSRY